MRANVARLPAAAPRPRRRRGGALCGALRPARRLPSRAAAFRAIFPRLRAARLGCGFVVIGENAVQPARSGGAVALCGALSPERRLPSRAAAFPAIFPRLRAARLGCGFVVIGEDAVQPTRSGGAVALCGALRLARRLPSRAAAFPAIFPRLRAARLGLRYCCHRRGCRSTSALGRRRRSLQCAETGAPPSQSSRGLPSHLPAASGGPLGLRLCCIDGIDELGWQQRR